MTETITIELAQGNILAGGIFTTSLVTPAPSGLLLALTGLPIAGFGAWMRRRRAMTPAPESKV